MTAAVTTKIGTNFTNIESVTGDGINDTLVGADVANTWTVNGANAGTVGTVAFSGFSNLTGGTNTDSFTLSGGTLSGALNGGTGTNTLTGDNVANSWTITGADAGTVTGISGGFSNIANLTGGTGTDSFTLNGGTLSGAIDGGLTGANTLTADNTANTWTISGADAGTVTGISGGFTNIANLTGGTGTDSFTLAGGTLSGAIDGGLTGANTLTADNTANTWTITAADAGTVTGVTSGFTNIGNLIGGTGTDSYTLSGGTLSGAIDGGAGTNSLTGDNVANTWVVNAADGGTVTGITGTFTNIGTLIGGNNADTFTFNPGGILSGPIDGGLGSDTLDFLSYGTTVSASPTVTGSGNVSGTPDPIAYAAGDDYTGMENVLATGGLSGPNGQTNAWDITGIDQFTLNGTTYSGMTAVVGGDQIDTFTIENGGQLTGATAIDGGPGANSIISVGNATWTLTGGDAGSIATTAGATNFVSIQTLTGGAGNDSFVLNGGTLSGAINGGLGVNTLTADNLANTWVINAADGGTVTGITGGFTNIGNLIGGNVGDTFVLNDGVVTSGSIDGGAGANTLDLSAYTTPRSILLTASGVNGFSGTEASIVGGFVNIGVMTLPATVANTLQAQDLANLWTLNGPDSGTLDTGGNVLSFSGVNNLVGGSAADGFTLAGGIVSGSINGGLGSNTLTGDNLANTWTITGADTGTVTGVTGGFTNIGNLIGGTGTDSFTLSGGTLSGAINGGLTGANTLTADNAANIWTITGADAGTVTGIAGGFTNIGNLTGGTGTDSFTLSGGTLSGAINGGLTGANTLTADNAANIWTITGADAGTVTGIAGGFTNIGNLTGGTGTDSFTLSGGTLSGAINGGLTGANTLTADNAANIWTITGADAGTVTGIAGGFTNIGNLTGGTGTDSFTLAGGTLSGAIDGGLTGTNTLIADNTANTWMISGTDAGTVTGVAGGFTNLGILVGGNTTDSFTFMPGGVLSGQLDGGLGSDTLDFTGYGSAVSASPTGTGSGKLSGTPDPITYAGTSDYVNVENVVGVGVAGPNGQTNIWDVTGLDQFTLNGTTFSGVTSVTGGDQVDTFIMEDAGRISGQIDGGPGLNDIQSVGNAMWSLTGADAGSIATTAGATTFVNIQMLTGGAGNDSFIINGGILSGAINGGVGVNSLTADNLANTWTITSADAGAVTGITGGFINIANLIGGSNTDSFTLSGGSVSGSINGGTGTNTLIADNVANTWSISGADTGTVTGVAGFSNIANLTGGSNNDAFTIGASGSVSGLIDGGLQVASDTLDYSAVTVAVTTKIGTNFTNIETVTGDGTNDTLVGADVANTWAITGANAGTVGTLAFNGFSNLTGGTGTDDFTLSGGTLSGAIDGGLIGANTLIADNTANTWTITGTDAGTVTGIIGGFTHIGNLTGGTGTDSFTLSGGSLSGAIDGGLTGVNNLTADNVSNTWVITALDSGTVTGITGGFSNIGNLAGGTGTDSFTLSGGTLSGAIDGGLTGANTLTADNAANTWVITALDSGTVTGVTGGFTHIGNLTGGTGTDSFTLSGGTLSGAINGGAGSNSLTGADVANAWTINGTDAGSVTGVGGGFNSIGTLIGGSVADNFSFIGTAVLSGPVDGGLGSDTIDFSGYATPVSVGPTGTGSGNVSATPDPINYAAGDDYTGMETVIATGGLIGPNGQTNLWDITALNQFILNGTTYSGMTSVLGGDQVDIFTIENNGRLTGTPAIDGGPGANVLQSVGDATWTLTGGDAGSIATLAGVSEFVNIQTLTGGAGNDSFILNGGSLLSGAINGGSGTNGLTGDNLASTWVINAANGGSVTDANGTVSFSNIGTLTGGTATDDYTLSGVGTLSGGIDGGLTGANSLTGNDLASTWVINAANGGSVTDANGTVSYSNIGTLTGGTATDDYTLSGVGTLSGGIDGGLTGANSLTGNDLASTWVINAANGGSVTDANGTVSYSNIGTLTGGTATDDYTLSGVGTLSGGIDGGLTGANSLTGNDLASTWVINAANGGSVTDANGTVSFSNIGTLTGGTATDDYTLSGVGTLSGGIDGGLTGANSLTGNDLASTWVINAANGGSVTDANGTVSYSNIGTLTGGTATDDYTLSGVGTLSGGIDGGLTGANSLTGNDLASTWVINAANGGSVTDANGTVSYSNIGTLTGGTATDDYTLSGVGTLSGGIDGGLTGANSLTGNDLASTWVINAANGGSVTDANGTVSYSNIGTLTGGTATDDYTLSGVGTLSGGIDGGLTGANSLTGNDLASTWVINAANGGSVTDANGTVSYSNIGTLTGGTATDDYTLSGVGTLSGGIDGGLTGANSLTGNDLASTWVINAADGGSVTDANGMVSFSNIGTLTGGTATDDYTLSGVGTLSGGIDGGLTGANSLTGNDLASTWVINAANGGSVTDANGTVSYSNIDNLIGGSSTDSFALNDGVVTSGSIDGGAGVDTLDLSLYTTARSVVLTGSGVDGFSGTEASVGGGFANIDVVTLPVTAINSLQGQDLATVWTISGANSGTLTTGGNVLTFTNANNLIGGSATDDFILVGVGTVSGSIDGGLTGANSLTGNDLASTWVINAADGGSVTDANGMVSFSNIGTLTGGTATDDYTLSGVGTLSGGIDGGLTGANSLTGNDLASTWVINAANGGSVTDANGTVSYSNIDNLIGGSSTDSFALNDGVVTSGSIDGGAGVDTLDLSLYTTARSVVLTGSGVDGFSGTEASVGGGFANIDVVTLPVTAINSLQGQDLATVWTISGANSGTLTTGGNVLTFTNANNLIGGSATDDFILVGVGTVSGSIDGGLTGANSLTGNDLASTWVINAADGGSVTDANGMVSFSNIGTLTGGTATDDYTLSGVGTLSGGIDGGLTGANSLTGNDLASTWVINAANGGSVTDANGTVSYSNIDNLIGGSSTDSFALNDGVVTSGSIDGGAGVDTLDLSLYTTARSVVLTGSGVDGFSGTEASVGGGFANIDVVTLPVTAINSLQGQDLATVWTISGANSGTLTTGGNVLTFTNANNLIGGSATDDFILVGVGTVSGSIDGGLTGANSLTGNDLASTWVINAADGGSVTDANGMVSFSNIGTLTGGTATDDYTLSGVGTLSGGIDGGLTGANSLTGNDLASTWVINAANGGSVTDANGTVSFSNIGTLIGGTATDDYTLSGVGTLSGSIDGGAGINSLQAADVANNWVVTGSRSGTVTGIGVGYSNIDNLIGGSAADSFALNDGVVTSGSIDGGTGVDTLDLSLYTTARSVVLTGSGIDGFSGTEASVGGGFANINVVTGPAATVNTLQAQDLPNVWTVSGINSGTLDTGGYVLTFNGMNNLVGGSDVDTFNFVGTAELDGQVNGGAGSDTLNFLGYSVPVSISPTGVGTGDAIAIPDPIINAGGDDYIGIEVVMASGSLIGPNGQDNNWDITGVNQITFLGTSFIGLDSIIGGDQIDTFKMEDGGQLTGTMGIDGGPGNNIIQSVGNATWTITGGADGDIATTAGATTFTNVQDLSGGAGNDNFVVTDAVVFTGSIDGGTGTDTLDLSAYTTDRNVLITGSGVDGFNGTEASIAGGFANIDVVTAPVATLNTLQGENLDNLWTVSAANTGTLNTAGNILAFNNFGTLKGGIGIDTFDLAAGVSGQIDGGGLGTDADVLNVTGDFTTPGSAFNVTDVETVADSGGFTVTTTDVVINNAATTIGTALAPLKIQAATLSIIGTNTDAYINEVDAIDLAGINLGGVFDLAAGGTITQSGAVHVTGLTTLAAGALNDIILNDVTNTFSTVGIVSGNNVTLRDADALDLAASTVSGNLDVATGGAITQSGAVSVAGTSSFNAGANPITLGNAANDFVGAVSLNNSGANDVVLTDANGLILGTSTLGSGALTVNAVGITQVGPIIQAAGAGAAVFNGGAGVIDLSNAGNDFTGPVSLNNSGANDVVLTDANGLILGTSTLGSGALTVNAVVITQVGPIIQAAGAGAAVFNGGAGVIDLSNAGNDFTGPVSLNNSGANDVVLTDANGLILGTSTLGSGALTVNAVGITQVGPIIQAAGAGAAVFNGGAGVIDLSNAGNDFTGPVSLNNSGANDATVTDSNAIDLGTSTVGGNLVVTAHGNITESGVLTVAGTSTFIIDTATLADVLLGTQLNDLAGAVTIATINGGTTYDINLRNVNSGATIAGLPATAHDLTITHDIAPVSLLGITLSGNMVITAGGVTAGGVAIDETGVLTVAGTSIFTVDTVQQADVLLDTQPNDFAGAVTISTLNGGTIRDVGLRNVNPSANLAGVPTILRNLTIIFDNAPVVLPLTTLTGNLDVIAGGDISQVGVVTVAGTSSLNAGPHAITLDNPNNDFGGAVMLINTGPNNIVITDVNAIVFGNSTIGSGTLTVNAVGITQTGPIIQEAAAGAATFNSGSGAIVLTDPGNDFTGPVSLNTSGSADASVVDSNAIDLGNSMVAGNLAVTASGDITESGLLTVAGTSTFTVDTAQNADVWLAPDPPYPPGPTDHANNLAGAVTITTVNGGTIRDIGLRNISPTASLAGVPTVARNLTIIFDNASVNLPVTTLSLDASNIGGNLVVLAGGSITQTGVLTIAGTATFAIDGAQQADVILGPVYPNDIAGLVTITTYNGGTIRDINLRNINVNANLLGMPNTARNFTILFDNAPVILPTLTLTGFLDITAGGVTPTLTSGALPANLAITQTGILTVAGTSTFTVDAVQNADVWLAPYPPYPPAPLDHANDLAGAVTITTINGGTIRDVGLRNINPSANLAGVPTILRNLTIIFDNAPVVLPLTTLTGNLVVIAGGDISQVGVVTVAGTSSLNAGPHAITLDNPNNDFGGAVMMINTGLNNIVITDVNNIIFGTSTIGSGTLTVNAIGITQIGPITQEAAAGAATFNSGSGAIVLTDPGNDFTGPVILNTTVSADASVVDSNEIILGASTVAGSLFVTAHGDITQVGVLFVSGAATFTMGTVDPLVYPNGADILLDTQLNDIAGLLTIQPVNDPADLTVPPAVPAIRDIGLRNINPGANLLGISPPIYARNFTIYFDNAPVILPETTLSGYMDITAGGVTAASTAITETGVLTVAGTSIFKVDTVQQADVLLDIEPNDLAGAVTITTINGGTIRDVGLRNVNPGANLIGVPTILRNLTIIFDNAAVNLPLTTLTGNLAVYAGGGPITQSDVLTVAGTSYLAANANSITLTNPANSFGGSISMFTLAFVTPTTDPATVITRLHSASITAVGNIDLGPAVIPATIPLPANPFTDGSYSVDGFDHADVSVDGHLSLVASGGNITDSGLVLYYYGGTFQVDGGYSIILDNNPLFRVYIAGSGGTTISAPETSLTLITGRVQNIAQSVQVLFVDPTYFFNNLDLYTLPGDTILSKPPAEIILRRIFR